MNLLSQLFSWLYEVMRGSGVTLILSGQVSMWWDDGCYLAHFMEVSADSPRNKIVISSMVGVLPLN